MISIPNAPLNPTNYRLGTGKQRMSTASSVQAGSFKLEKLKKLWARRVKPIIASGTNLASVSKVHRRRTVVTEMIGFPQDFTHSKHVGIHEMIQLEPQLRHSNDVQRISLFGSGEWSSHFRLPEPEVEVALNANEAHTMPFVSLKHSARHSICASPAPARPTAKKVKRKSVPIHILQDIADSSAHEVEPTPTLEINQHRFSCLSIDETLMQLINYDQPQQSYDNQVERTASDVGGLTCQF